MYFKGSVFLMESLSSLLVGGCREMSREEEGRGQNRPEEIRDLIKLPVWVRALRCKAALHDNGSLSEFHSTEGSFFST